MCTEEFWRVVCSFRAPISSRRLTTENGGDGGRIHSLCERGLHLRVLAISSEKISEGLVTNGGRFGCQQPIDKLIAWGYHTIHSNVLHYPESYTTL